MYYNDNFISGDLPLPLDEQELLNVIDKAQRGDKEASNKAVIHNMRFVIDYVKKYLDMRKRN